MKEADNELKIVTSDEEITFSQYMNRLNELLRDCLREEYLAEIFIPFVRMCCPEGVKIIPIYDDRRSGPKTDNETVFKDRMKKICALKDDGSYTVPDYIFVSEEYTVSNPIKPYLMVETKMPRTLKDGKYYRPLHDSLNDIKIKDELISEIKFCGIVIYTDGIYWMFLTLNDKGEVMSLPGYETISLVTLKDKYYSTYYATIKEDVKHCDLSEIGLGEFDVITEPKEWKELKKSINRLLVEAKKL